MPTVLGPSAPAAESPRPSAKPPFVDRSVPFEIPDDVPISSLTDMRVGPWRICMDTPNRHGISFGALFPEDCAQISEGIEHGVPVDFVGDRTERFGPNLPISIEDRPKVSKVINDDVRDGKKAGPYARKPFPIMCISPIGCVPKKNSEKVRVIHHLSFPHGGDSVNASILKKEQQLPRFGTAARAIRRLGKGALLIKLDVSAAYKQIPVRKQDWPLLGFLWEGQYYYERVLPFGLRSSCRLWDLYAAALHYFLFEQTGVDCAREVIHYVDDFLFVVAPGKEAEAHRMLEGAKALCAKLGLPLAADKTEGPTTCLTFLGIELDSVALEARLPKERLAEINLRMMEWGKRTSASIKELQSIAGLLNFACAVVPPGRYFVRRIWNKVKALTAAGFNRHAAGDLGPEVMKDFAWWQEFLPRWNGISMLYNKDWENAAHISLATDACDTGFGGHWGSRWFEGTWAPAVWSEAMRDRTKRSMPFCELYALVVAATLWGKEWHGKKVIFECDCMPVVQAVEKCNSKSDSVMHLLRILCNLACEHGFDFKVAHIRGVTNIIADALSRYGDCQEFRALCPNAYKHPMKLPEVPLPSPYAELKYPKPREPSPLSLSSAKKRNSSHKPLSALGL